MIGVTISHYKITEKLGEGGMGVVYKADDTRLDRPVALKFLAPHLLRDEEGRKRFEREAKAAAKLDHPNICTVYEIDEADGRTFIVMAFLEGRPLSERIKEGPLKLAEALSVAIQMAEGLEAAHAKGITHRDIKPDNVMLMSGSRGLIKLMDFGLAQLAGSSKFTREGTTLGTVNYMSPEQGEGAETDPRTDIWSLGVVLYEMIAGQRPFRGDFDQSIIYSILNEPAEPLTGVRTGVPKELERIVDKCLEKNTGERYQHVGHLLVDLQACLRGLEPRHSRAGVPVPLPKRISPRIFGGLAAAVLAAVGLGWWFGTPSESTAEGPPEYRLTQITRDIGYTGDPALSPDGRLLAYTSDRSGDGNLDIWVQQIGGGEPIRLTTHEADDLSPSFSPDGNRIAFQSRRDGGGIYIVPALGGTPRRIADGHANVMPRFSPDGASVSYTQLDFPFHRAWVVPTSGGAPRQIETNLGAVRPHAWSPDGRYLLAIGFIGPVTRGRGDMWLVPVEGGDAVALGVPELFEAAGLEIVSAVAGVLHHPWAWSADGDWVVFDARTQGATRNLWRVRISASEKRLVGEPQKLTAGVGEEQASMSRDGRIAFTSESNNWDIWSLPIDANRAEVTGEPERIVSGLDRETYPSISSDGRKLVYTSDRAGNDDIWLRDLELNKDTQITVGPAPEFRGVISPDGTKVVFRRFEGEQRKTNIYLTELGRGSERLLLEDVGSHMDFTPDGKKILFYTNAPFRQKTLDIETGEQHDLGLEHSPDGVGSVRFSPDQNWVSFKLATWEAPVFVSRIIGGVAQEQSSWVYIGDAPAGGVTWWSPDGNTLYAQDARDGFRCIWACSLDPATKEPLGPFEEVQHFHDNLRHLGANPASFGYGLTGDKHYMALAESSANIWLAEPQPSQED